MTDEQRLEKAATLITRLSGEYTGAITAHYWQIGKEYLAPGIIEKCSVLNQSREWLNEWISSKPEPGDEK